jgi:hypothetical protein
VRLFVSFVMGKCGHKKQLCLNCKTCSRCCGHDGISRRRGRPSANPSDNEIINLSDLVEGEIKRRRRRETIGEDSGSYICTYYIAM